MQQQTQINNQVNIRAKLAKHHHRKISQMNKAAPRQFAVYACHFSQRFVSKKLPYHKKRELIKVCEAYPISKKELCWMCKT